MYYLINLIQECLGIFSKLRAKKVKRIYHTKAPQPKGHGTLKRILPMSYITICLSRHGLG